MNILFGVPYLMTVMFAMTINAADANQNIPKKIDCGESNCNLTVKERIGKFNNQIKLISEAELARINQNIVMLRINKLMEILPEWTHEIPPTIPLYVDFVGEEADDVLGYKYIRLGLFVRDMYEDYPINTDVFGTFPIPKDKRFSKPHLHKLVARCFATAFDLLTPTSSNLPKQESIDNLSSRMLVATWGLYHSSHAPVLDVSELYKHIDTTLDLCGQVEQKLKEDDYEKDYQKEMAQQIRTCRIHAGLVLGALIAADRVSKYPSKYSADAVQKAATIPPQLVSVTDSSN